MIKALLSILNVVEGEEKPVLLILGYGFFMGVFLAAYKIVATTLFLSNQHEYLKEAFFVSGLIGVITTYLYAIMQNRVQYSKLIIFNIISVFLFIAITRILFMYYDNDFLVFILFVMLGPITSLLVLGFWGIFGRLFDLRQSKRIIGGIDSGQLTAIIITTFSIPFLIPYVADITNILVIGEIGLAISIVFFIYIILNFKLSSFHSKQKEFRDETKFKNMFKSRYIIYLAFFLLLSMTAYVFVDFSFMNVTEQQYPDEKQLASFLGVFEGSIMVLSLLIQTFANERILSMYGMRTSLVILPLILLFFTILSLVAAYFYGYDISSPNFIWFFLFIALSKMFVTTLREATENPVFKLFFMPLDSRVRFDIQTKIEGTINEFARALSGGLILLFGMLPFFELVHYSWILVAIIIGWLFMIFRIYYLYKENITLKLQRQRQEANKIEQKGKSILVEKIYSSIKSKNPNLMIFALRALSKIAPDVFKSKIEDIKNDHSIVLDTNVLKTLEGDFSFTHVASLKNIEELRRNKKSTSKASNNLALEEEIQDMIKSHDVAERKLAAELIVATEAEDSVFLLTELMNDPEKGVVNAAMKAASELQLIELLPLVVENMQKRKYKDLAIEALQNYGELAFHGLEVIFYNSEQNVDIKLEIVDVYGKIGGEKAKELLWNKIDYPDKKVVAEVFIALSHCGFEADPDQVQRIKQAIEEGVAGIVWNLKVKQQLNDSDGKFEEIIHSLTEENVHGYQHIFMLLSMLYDQKSIQLVKENIDSKTNEGISYGVELLDVFLSEDLKQKIVPIFDDTTDLDRIRRLQMFYPTIDVSIDDTLKGIINQEFRQVNRWTKAATIQYIGSHKISGKFDLELISNLFNPDILLKEISAWAMNEIDGNFYNENVVRLPVHERDHLRNLQLGQEFYFASELRPHMRFEIVKFLKEKTLLEELPFYVLSRIVNFIEDVYLENKTVIDPSGWSNDCFYIIYNGFLEIRNSNSNVVDQFGDGDFLGEQINIDLMEDEISINIVGDSVLLKIEKSKFFDLITNEYDVTLKLLNSFDEHEKEISI